MGRSSGVAVVALVAIVTAIAVLGGRYAPDRWAVAYESQREAVEMRVTCLTQQSEIFEIGTPTVLVFGDVMNLAAFVIGVAPWKHTMTAIVCDHGNSLQCRREPSKPPKLIVTLRLSRTAP